MLLRNSATRRLFKAEYVNSVEYKATRALYSISMDNIGNYYYQADDSGFEYIPCKSVEEAQEILNDMFSLIGYCIRDREAGNVIVRELTIIEAKNTLIEFENEDRKDGTYSRNFYEIYNEQTEKIFEEED